MTAPAHANENEQTLNDKIEYLNKQPQTPETIKELDIYLQAQNQVAKAKEFNRLTKQYDDLIDTFPKQVAALKLMPSLLVNFQNLINGTKNS
ncbi:hypothetical protein Q8W15_21120 [Photobacterium damselae subsp. piscicida]|nr:hypothetical protein [Photobacterium damselae subsp. piscicida]MDP2569889.1 hypothetical protein [Photobacterium damselae subsp. piscicida]